MAAGCLGRDFPVGSTDVDCRKADLLQKLHAVRRQLDGLTSI